MAWLKIDDRVRTHPKIVEAGPVAAWFWFCGICYCREHLTDGLIADKMLPTLVPGVPSWKRPADVLVAAGLWHREERGYRVHDFLEWNPSRAEIEAQLLAHPDIAQVAVVGVPDERMGEVGVAFVVPVADTTVDPDEVIAWSREHMANYKVPRRVEIIDALPLNASGKVLKFELRDRATAGS